MAAIRSFPECSSIAWISAAKRAISAISAISRRRGQPGQPNAARCNTARHGANGGQTSRQTRARGKFRDLAFHFWRRVAWSHKVTSYSHIFRYAGQVRTTVSE
jgi:hypothetical protein